MSRGHGTISAMSDQMSTGSGGGTGTDADEASIAALCDQLLAEHPPATTDPVAFLGAQFDLGLAWVHFPVGYGGLGLTPKLQVAINTRLSAAGAPEPFSRNPIGWGMGAPTVVTHGSEAQKRRYLRPLFAGEEIWCQMFSEPGAGSDVAGLSTMAVRDGDEWVVNGQKVWTSLGHLARWGMLVARTDPSAVKHKGLSYFVVDMHAPGVEVRPLRQMTGEAEFNEVFFTDVRIPDAERLGDVGQGWHVALTTLMNERVSLGGSVAPRGSGLIGRAVDLWCAVPSADRDPVRRDRLTRLWIEAETIRLTNMRAAGVRTAGVPGPEGSVGKLATAEFNKRITEFFCEILGPASLVGVDYTFRRPSESRGMIERFDDRKLFLRMRAQSIEGGTSEVMRNILGERVLGLPGDVRVDRDRPWSEVPRS
jgi:alkylation response protein AidB-like acyl-CoA dehydrogenase